MKPWPRLETWRCSEDPDVKGTETHIAIHRHFHNVTVAARIPM